MNEDNKLYEVLVNEEGVRFRHNNPNPLSAEQKHSIIMALIALVAGALGIVLVWVAAKLCGFLGLLLALLAVGVIIAVVVCNLNY